MNECGHASCCIALELAAFHIACREHAYLVQGLQQLRPSMSYRNVTCMSILSFSCHLDLTNETLFSFADTLEENLS